MYQYAEQIKKYISSSTSLKDLILKIGLKSHRWNREKITLCIKQLNLDISHFNIYKCSKCNKAIYRLGNFERHIKKCGVYKIKLPHKSIHRKAWNKGLTKETNDIIKQQAYRASIRMKKELTEGRRKMPISSLEFRKALSIRQSTHNSGGKCKWYEVNGQKVQGTWERQIAQILEEYKIKWMKLHTFKDVWEYTMQGEIKHYTPDFYLQDFNMYLEIKGYWWGNDKEKMQCVKEQYQDKKILMIEINDYKAILKNHIILINMIRGLNSKVECLSEK